MPQKYYNTRSCKHNTQIHYLLLKDDGLRDGPAWIKKKKKVLMKNINDKLLCMSNLIIS